MERLNDALGVTRLAPSPTGALHLGNARTFLVNWALARQRGWRVLLRIEDLDHPRVKPETIDQTRAELRWLGLDWDDEVPLQTTDLEPCHSALQKLGRAGLIYACTRSRAELLLSAPNEGDQTIRAAAADRPAEAGQPIEQPKTTSTWRLMVEPGLCCVSDAFCGDHQIDVATDCGDFAVWSNRGCPTYQLAVTVDDARQGVNQVVRGDDLLSSAARQQCLQAHLRLPTPTWWHLPLLRGPDGRRLAKRHGDTRISRWRSGRPDRLVGLLASFCTSGDDPVPMTASAFLETFDIDRVPRSDVIVTSDHIRWLDA
ncbi:MAG: glutamate--tRNA ligase family protein [Phycisphaerales bacterium]|nr:glutamate--tRNA ligase family protein [Phycisphaerales bacterium]